MAKKENSEATASAPADVRVENLMKRSEEAWKKKANFDTLYRDAYKFGMPQRDGYDSPAPGQKKGSEVFDSTGATATESFANRLQTELCPPFQRFCGLEAGPLVPKKEKTKLNKALQQVTERMFAVLDISNFHTAVNEFFLDLAAGTGVLFAEEDKGTAHPSPVRFTAVPANQVALEEGPHGTVEGVFYRWKVCARLIKRTWPDAVLSATLAKMVEDDPETEVEFECVTVFDDAKGVFVYDVIHKEEKTSILRRPRRYKENPWIVTRWMKASGEVNGRGPLLSALPDIKTLNKLVELVLKNASLAVSGAYTAVDDGVLNPNVVRIIPGAVIPVARNAGHPSGPSLAPLPRSGDFDVAMLERDDLRMTIKKALYDSSLPPDAGPVRSATEIVQRMKDLASNIGAAFGRLMTEFIQPLVRRLLGVMERAGLLNDIGSVKVTGYLVAVKVTSPLARLQNAQDIEAVLNWLQMIAMLGPEMMMLGAKVEDIPEWLAGKLGIPSELVREPKERESLQKMAAQAMAANAQANNPTAAVAMGNGGTTQVPEAQVA